jgi:hypothetical protein
MSGTSARMSTMPACAMVCAGEICGGASALAAAENKAKEQARKNAVPFEKAWTIHLFVIPAKAGLRRQDAGANIGEANGPKGAPQERRVTQ